MIKGTLKILGVIVLSSLTLAFWAVTWQSLDPLAQLGYVYHCANEIGRDIGKSVKFSAGLVSGRRFILGYTENAIFEVAGEVVWNDDSTSTISCLVQGSRSNILSKHNI